MIHDHYCRCRACKPPLAPSRTKEGAHHTIAFVALLVMALAFVAHVVRVY